MVLSDSGEVSKETEKISSGFFPKAPAIALAVSTLTLYHLVAATIVVREIPAASATAVLVFFWDFR